MLEQHAAPIFAALGDPTRLQLLQQLSAGERKSIAELSRELPLTRQAVTKHLAVLENAGVVDKTRTGRESRYHYVPAPVLELQDYLEAISGQWDDALARLRRLVEE